jgi:hypothetical protein
MGYAGRGLPPRILHDRGRLLSRGQTRVRLAGLVVASFILDYFCESATEDGHKRAGHGQGMFLCQQEQRLRQRTMKADVPDAVRKTVD